MFMIFLIGSWNDGDPEYLNDLDRQVVQKERLRQVSACISNSFHLPNPMLLDVP